MAVAPSKQFKHKLTEDLIQKALEKLRQYSKLAVKDCYYDIAGPSRYREMLDFYRDHFCPDEIINISLDIPWDSEVEKAYMECVGQNISLILVSAKTNKIIGGRIMFVANRDDDISSAKYNSETYRKLNDITNDLADLYNMFDHYNVEDMIHFFGLGIHRDYRQRGLGTRLMEAALMFIQSFGVGPVLVRGEGSSNISQRVFENVGFQCLATIVYDEYKVNGEVVIRNSGENKTYKLYGKSFD